MNAELMYGTSMENMAKFYDVKIVNGEAEAVGALFNKVPEFYAICILSDVQHLMLVGEHEEARQLINRVKFLLSKAIKAREELKAASSPHDPKTGMLKQRICNGPDF